MSENQRRADVVPRAHLREHRERVLAWSQAHAAQRIGVHASTLWRWESGQITVIRPYDLHMIANAYGLSYEDLDRIESHRSARPDKTVLSWDVHGTVEAFRLLEGSGMNQQLAGLRAGDDLTGIAREWLTAPAASATAHEGSTSARIDMTVVEHLEGMVLRLRHLDDEIGGADLLPVVRQRHQRMSTLLSATYTSAVGRRLHAVAADLGHLLGWLAFDTGQHTFAQRQWIAALHAAHSADDPLTGANILAGLAMQAYALDRPHDGLSLSQTAEQGLPTSASPHVRSMLACRQAVAAAKIGDAITAGRALNRAEDLLDTDDPDAPTWLYYYGRADEELHTGTAWLALDEPRRAEQAFQNALQCIDPTHVRDRGVILSRVALTRLAQGEVEGAALAANDALLLCSTQLHSLRAVDELTDVDHALSAHLDAAPGARDFHDHYTTLVNDE